MDTKFSSKGLSVLIAGTVMAAASTQAADSMAVGLNDYEVSPPILTIGETLYFTTGALNSSTEGAYTPVGILDGMGATELDDQTVRVFVNHELLHFRGNEYFVNDGQGSSFGLTGARISYFDIDKYSLDIVDGGIAYNTIFDARGEIATDLSFQPEPFASAFGGAPGDGAQLQGFSRFCSGSLFEDGTFERYRYRLPFLPKRGLEDTIYFAGEEDGSGFNSVGGGSWGLDVEKGELHAIPSFGRGAWENLTFVDTFSRSRVAVILADDSSPFDADNDGEDEAAPLYLYIGRKDRNGDFLERNGLSGGQLYVFVPDNSNLRTPLDFRGDFSRMRGSWVAIDNSPSGEPSEDGSTGFDEFGYPTQSTLWTRAEALGAFGFSRPEDLSTSPSGQVAVLASTGVDTFAVDPATGNGADTFGTMYTIRTNFRSLRAEIVILYDGDADPERQLRSPDNLDWADDGFIYVQEDEAEEDTLTGDEVLFGEGAANPNEAGIVRINPRNGNIVRVANVNREVILDASIPLQTDAVDVDAGDAGEWETSGIIDVSSLFDAPRGSLFLFNVQAHGIEDQEEVNADSRINDDDLAEGGQLLFLRRAYQTAY